MNRNPAASRTDAHIHLFAHGWSGAGEADADLVAYEAIRREHGIGEALVVCYEGEERFAGNNTFVASLVADHPWIRPVAYVPATEAGRRGVSGLTAPFVGTTLYLTDERSAEAASSWPARTWDALRARHGVISLNVRRPLLPAAVQLARAADPVPVLLSHLGLPGVVDPADPEQSPAQVLRSLVEAAAVANVHVKVSGLYALGPAASDLGWQRGAVAAIVSAYGAARVHWGSDFPPVLDHETVEGALAKGVLSALAPEVAEAVRGTSLATLLAGVQQ